jgi:hypothetical protein
MTAADPSPTRSHSQAHEPAAARTAPLALWRVAEGFLQILHALFGAPERIAAQHTLTAKAHAHMALWLRCAEAMLRRLLLIEASAYDKPNTRPLLTPPRQRMRKLMSFTAEEPEKWRVSFRCLSLDRRLPAGKPSCRQDAGGPSKRISREDRCSANWKPVKFRSAWPLAERFEALIRVFNDPAPYARRLARRLHANPHRLAEMLRAPPEAEHRIDRYADFCEGAKAASASFGLRVDTS